MRSAPVAARLAIAAAVSIFALSSCRKQPAGPAHVRLGKLNPVDLVGPTGVDVSGAWSLFDRDTRVGWTVPAPAGVDLAITASLRGADAVTAVKVFGPSPYRLAIEGARGARTELDLSTLGVGWNTLRVAEARSPVTLHIVPTGAAGAIAEMELWGEQKTDDRRIGDLLPAGADEATLAAHVDLVPGTPSALRIAPASADTGSGGCGEFLLDIPRAPELYRRAWIVFDSTGAFRPFELTHYINGRLIKLGDWIAPASQDELSSWSEPIDPAWLFRGPNLIELCVPAAATTPVEVERVRLVAEMENGANLVSRITAGVHEAAAVADGSQATEALVGPEAPLVFQFERYVAPDRVEIAASADPGWTVTCLAPDGEWATVSTRFEPGVAEHLPALAVLDRPECSALQLAPETDVSVREAAVIGSGARERVDWPRLVVASPREHFGTLAWLDGWVTTPREYSGPVDLSVDAAAYGSLSTSVFATRIERADDVDGPWVVDITADLSDRSISEEVVLDGTGRLELEAALEAAGGAAGSGPPDTRYGAEDQTVSADASPEADTQVRLGTDVGIDVPAGAVSQKTRLSVTHVAHRDLPPLNPGLLNVTAPRGHAYEFTPHGQRFLKPVQVLVPIETAALPQGFGAEDVVTYFYDTAAGRWEPLARASVDDARGVLRSLTDHFTLMINAVLIAPEHPTTADLKPTTISELQAANPMSKVNLIAPPQAAANGDAKLRYPIETPPGRGGLQPELAIEYDSARGNGWLGVGWDLPVSAIGIDTRWGAPRYDASRETETYTLDGAQLTPVAHRTLYDDLPARSSVDKIFHTRVEGSFRRIVRHGTTPASYWWEITDKNGTRYAYGRLLDRSSLDATLAGPNGIYRWALREVRDLRGNWMRFEYVLERAPGRTLNATRGRQLYLSRIDYTGHQSDDGAYQVILRRASDLGEAPRSDAVIDYTGGFRQETADLLRQIQIQYAGAVVRRYDLEYSPEQTGTSTPFGKTLLSSVRQLGAGLVPFPGNVHQFEYYDDVRIRNADSTPTGDYQGFSSTVDTWNTGDDSISREELPGMGGVSALGTSATRTKGNHPFGGFSYQPSKSGAIGNTTGNTLELSEEVVVFSDVDGDGLPDKIFRKGEITDDVTDLVQILAPGGEGNVFPADLYYRRNLGPGTKKFGEARRVWENGVLPRDSTRNYSVSLEWYPELQPFDFSLSTYLTYSLGLSDTYMADVNGDGLVDIVHRGQVFFNHRVDGEPRFLLGSAGTPAPIWAGAQRQQQTYRDEKLADVADVMLDPIDVLVDVVFDTIPSFIDKLTDFLPDWLSGPLKWLVDPLDMALHALKDWVKDKLGRDQFRNLVANVAEPSDTGPTARGLVDVLRRWEAPYDGTVAISGDVALTALSTHPGADGVRVAIQRNEIELWSEVIGPLDTSPHVPASVNAITVQAGDRIYFRVGSINDALEDEVAWNPVVEYTDSRYAGIQDQNGLGAGRFSASDDFTLAGRPAEVVMPLSGTIHLEGDVLRTGRTSDDVTAQVIVATSHDEGGETVTTLGTLSASTEGGSIPVDALLVVNQGDRVKLRLVADSPIDVTILSWRPRLYYSGAEGLTDAYDSNSNPVVDIYPAYDIDTYPLSEVATPQRPWRVPTQDDTSCPSRAQGPCADGVDNDGNGSFDCGDPNCTPPSPAITTVKIHATATSVHDDTVFFTVKRAGALLHKEPLAVVVGQPAPSADFDLAVNEGDELYFTFSSRAPADLAISHVVKVTYGVRDEVVDCDADADCSGGICQTGGVARVCGAAPITVTAPSALYRQGAGELWPRSYRGWAVLGYEGIGARGATPIDEALLDVANTNPMGGVVYPLTPNTDPQLARWDAANEHVFAAAGLMASGRSVDLAYDPALEGDQLSDAVSRRSRTLQTSVSASGSVSATIKEVLENLDLKLGLGANVSKGWGSSWSKLDSMDLNGDRYPDVVGDGAAQYTWATGGLTPDIQSFGDRVRKTEFENWSAGAGINAGPANPPVAHGDGRGNIHSPGTAPSNGANAGEQKSGHFSGGANESLSKGSSNTAYDWIDLNGDGLPDHVRVSGDSLLVQFNTGYGLDPASADRAVVWGIGNPGSGHSSHNGAGINIGYGGDKYDVGGGTAATTRTSFTDAALLDMNGDGLVDAVWGGSTDLRVAFNTGAGFAAPVAWKGALTDDGKAVIAKSEGTEKSVSAYFTVAIGPLCYVSCYVIINGGKHAGSGVARQTTMLRDIDGDGLLDHLTSTSDSQISAVSNRTGRTNLLARVRRPYGSEIQLAYRRSENSYELPRSQWVLAGVAVNDGLIGDNPHSPVADEERGADVQASRFDYAGGYYDRKERESYGFDTVSETQLDTRGMSMADAFAAVSGSTTTYDYRRIRRTYLNRTSYQKGLLAEEQNEAPTPAGEPRQPFSRTTYAYEYRDVATGTLATDIGSTTATIFPALRSVTKIRYEGSASQFVATSQAMDYDTYGNVTSYVDYGDAGPADDLIATVTYTGTSGLHSLCASPNRYIVGKPDSVSVVDGSGNPLRRRRGHYDCRFGELGSLLEYGGASPDAMSSFTYDAYGALETVAGPANLHGERHQLKLTYDSFAHTYVTRVDDLSFGYYSESAYDPRFGEMTSTTDVNGNTYTRSFDDLGRLYTVTAPYELDRGAAYTVRHTYAPEANPPRTLTEHFDSFGAPSIRTVVFADGFGRLLQTKRDATLFTGENSSPIEAMVVSGRVVFDQAGRVSATWYPTTDTRSSALQFSPAYDGQPSTRTRYDLLDRPVLTTFPDGTTLASSYAIGLDAAGVKRLIATTIDPESKVKRVFRGMRDLLMAVEERNAGLAITTQYAYDGLNQLTEVRDAGDNPTHVLYDLLGRRLSVDNRDTGKVEQKYDGAGNVVERMTPNLRASDTPIQLDYAFDRLVAIHYPEHVGNDVTYRFGEASLRGQPGNRVGRLVSVTDGSGKLERAYGKLGEVTIEARSISPAAAVHTGTFVTQYTYDSYDRLRVLTYPDGEKLTYEYDGGGQPSTVSGARVYVSRLEYDKFGQRAFMRLGNGVSTRYTYDPLMNRLARLTSTPDGAATFQDLAYEYYPAGNIKSLINNVAAPQVGFGGHVAQRFVYDDLYRLTNATGEFTGRLGNERYDLAMLYDQIHNVVHKTQTHTVQRDGGPTQVQRSTTYDWVYMYGGSRPHAPTLVGDRSFSWEDNGNLTGWQSLQSAQKRTIQWDEENRVQSITDNGRTTRFVYDASGDRIVKSGVRGESIYANTYFTAQGGGPATKHVFVGTTRVASVVEPGPRDMLFLSEQFPGQGVYHWSSTAAEHAQNQYKNRHLMAQALGVPEDYVYFYHPDHLGSTSFVTDETGRIYEHLEYFPFGETWVEEAANANRVCYLFTSKELDQETGLYYFGARYLDPRLSTWLSPDALYLRAPERALQDTVELSLYTYGRNNPMKYTDPTGYAVYTTDRSPLEDWKRMGLAVLSFAGGTFKLITGVFGASWQEEVFNEQAEQIQNNIDTTSDLYFNWDEMTPAEKMDIIQPLVTALAVAVVVHKAAEGAGRGGTRAAAGAAGNNPEQSALIDMAKGDRRTSITPGDAHAYKDLGKEAGVPVRGPEVHPNRPHGKDPHIHVGPVDHIPVRSEGQ